ncbi:MAG: septal junction protein FraD [Hassallia sp.]
MNFLFLKDLFGVFKFLEDVYARVRRLLVPPKAYSWQTLIYLSIFSWFASSLAVGYVRDIISFFGWLFLIAGTSWYTTDDPLRIPGTFMPIGAVLTGFLVSVFAFGQGEDVITPRTIVLWPTISALITAIPEFFEGSGTDVQTQIPKPEIRQRLIVMVASCMILSCWIQFYFVMDNWLTQYPSLQADNFKQSTFVIRTESPDKIPANGVVILDKLQPLVEEQVAERPWSEVERWLINADQQVGNLGKRVIERNLAKYEEKELWVVRPHVVNTKSGYTLDLLSIWTGPSSNPRGFYVKKSCRVNPIAAPTNSSIANVSKPDKATVAEIDCDRVSKFIAGSPPAQQ